MLLSLLDSISRSYPFIKGRGRLANSKLWKNSIKNIDQLFAPKRLWENLSVKILLAE